MIVPALSRSVAARVVSAVLLAAPAVMAAQPVPPPAQRTPMARLLIDEPRVQLGVTVRDIDPADNKQAGQSGALITSVQPGSAAAAAGLQTSDLVVEFDGERVRSARQFARLVQETPPGRAVNASLLRDGRKQQVSLTLVREPRTRAFNDRDRLLPRFDVDRWPLRDRLRDFGDRLGRLPPPLGPAAPRLGVAVREMTPELAQYFGADDGVLVSSVTEDSAASRAGLRVGDVITTAGGGAVRSRADLLRTLRDASGDLTIEVVRAKKSLSITASIETPQAPGAHPGSARPPERPL